MLCWRPRVFLHYTWFFFLRKLWINLTHYLAWLRTDFSTYNRFVNCSTSLRIFLFKFDTTSDKYALATLGNIRNTLKNNRIPSVISLRSWLTIFGIQKAAQKTCDDVVKVIDADLEVHMVVSRQKASYSSFRLTFTWCSIDWVLLKTLVINNKWNASLARVTLRLKLDEQKHHHFLVPDTCCIQEFDAWRFSFIMASEAKAKVGGDKTQLHFLLSEFPT